MPEKRVFKARRILLPALDIIIVIIAHLSALSLRNDYQLGGLLNHLIEKKPVLLVVVLFHIVSFCVFRINKSLWEFVSVDEAMMISIAVMIADFFVYIFYLLDPNYSINSNILIIAMVFTITGMLGVRIIYRYLRLQKKMQAKSEKAVIIGAGSGGNLLYREIINNDRYPCRIVGFIDDDINKKGHSLDGYKILGTTNEIKHLKDIHEFTIAFIAIPSASKNNIRNIINKCQEANLKTRIMEFSEVSNTSSIRDVSIDDLLGRGEVKLDNSSIEQYLRQKSLLVTGAGGSIGSELCRQVARFRPSKLIMIDIYENNLYDLQMEFAMLKRSDPALEEVEMHFIIASVTDEKALDNIFAKHKPDVVYHAAAHKHVPLMETVPREAYINNVKGTYRVIKTCIKHEVDKFILISTDKAVNPTNVMGATKRIVELMVQALKNNGITTLSAVRFGNVLNSHGSVIPLFKKQIEKTGVITITDPGIQRYFMTIPEAAQLVIQAGAYAQNGEIFVLDMGQPVKILDLAENLIRLSGLKPHEDVSIEYIGLRPGEKLYEELVYNIDECHKTDNELIFIAQPEVIDQTVFSKAIEELNSKLDDLVDIRDELLEFINRDFSRNNNIIV